MPHQLRPHQLEALSFYINNIRCADTSDPGTGKTGPACVYIQYLWEVESTKSIWAMPKSLLHKNKRELLAFSDLTEDQIVIVDGTPKQRALQLASTKGIVFLMGFQRFSDDWQLLKETHPQINALIVDEVHMAGYKNPTSKRCASLFAAMQKIKYYLAMSGTLIDGRLDSCYATIHLIEPRYYANHYSFLAQHAIKDDYGNILAWVNHEKLGRIFLRHTFRKTFEEVYGDVDKVYIKEKIPMDSKTRKSYEEFEQLACLELDEAIAAALENDSGFLEGTNGAVNAIRCRQIMQHPHKYGLLKPEELTGKEELIELHVENHLRTKKPLIIFSSLQPEQERLTELCTKWGLRTAMINGNVSPQKRAVIDQMFQEGKLDCVVASPATAAVGFNWGHCDHIIFVSLDYQDVNFVQGVRRAVRGVRETQLLITILEYEDSIDHRIFQIVDLKSVNKHKVDPTYEILELSKLKAA